MAWCDARASWPGDSTAASVDSDTPAASLTILAATSGLLLVLLLALIACTGVAVLRLMTRQALSQQHREQVRVRVGRLGRERGRTAR